jgi:hypothetical protein
MNAIYFVDADNCKDSSLFMTSVEKRGLYVSDRRRFLLIVEMTAKRPEPDSLRQQA